MDKRAAVHQEGAGTVEKGRNRQDDADKTDGEHDDTARMIWSRGQTKTGQGKGLMGVV